MRGVILSLAENRDAGAAVQPVLDSYLRGHHDSGSADRACRQVRSAAAGKLIRVQQLVRASLGAHTIWLGQESVADASNRDQMPGPRGIVLDITPQPNYKIVDRARVCVFLQPPDLFQN